MSCMTADQKRSAHALNCIEEYPPFIITWKTRAEERKTGKEGRSADSVSAAPPRFHFHSQGT